MLIRQIYCIQSKTNVYRSHKHTFGICWQGILGYRQGGLILDTGETGSCENAFGELCTKMRPMRYIVLRKNHWAWGLLDVFNCDTCHQRILNVNGLFLLWEYGGEVKWQQVCSMDLPDSSSFPLLRSDMLLVLRFLRLLSETSTHIHDSIVTATAQQRQCSRISNIL